MHPISEMSIISPVQFTGASHIVSRVYSITFACTSIYMNYMTNKHYDGTAMSPPEKMKYI